MRYCVAAFALAALLGCERVDPEERASEMSFSSGAIGVSHVYAAEPATGERTVMYFTLSNFADHKEQLVSVTTDAAERADIHLSTEQNGRKVMQPVPGVVIPAGWQIHFAPGSYHVMLEEPKDGIEYGDTIEATLYFESGATLQVKAEVRGYDELEQLLQPEDAEPR